VYAKESTAGKQLEKPEGTVKKTNGPAQRRACKLIQGGFCRHHTATNSAAPQKSQVRKSRLFGLGRPHGEKSQKPEELGPPKGVGRPPSTLIGGKGGRAGQKPGGDFR